MTLLATSEPIGFRDFPDAGIADGPPATFGEAFGASYGSIRLLSASDSRLRGEDDAVDEMVSRLNGAGEHFDAGDFRVMFGQQSLASRDELYAAIKRRRTVNRDALEGLPDSDQTFAAFVAERVNAESQDQAHVLGRVATMAGGFGELLGGFVGGARDPLNLVLMPFGAPRALGVLRTMLVESAIGAGSAAALAPTVAAWRKEVGLDYSADEFWDSVGFGAGGGALFGAAAKIVPALAHAARLVGSKEGRELIRQYRASKFRTPDGDAAARMAEAAIETEATNPLGPAGGAREEHMARLGEALKAVAEGRPPAMPDMPLFPVAERARWLSSLPVVDPADLKLAARAHELGQELEQLAGRLTGLPAGDAAAASRLARLDAVERELANPDLEAAARKTLSTRRDELLTDTTPEKLKTAATPIGAARDLENQVRQVAIELAGVRQRMARAEAIDALKKTMTTPDELDAVRSNVLDKVKRNLARLGEADPRRLLARAANGPLRDLLERATHASGQGADAVADAFTRELLRARDEGLLPDTQMRGEPVTQVTPAKRSDGGPNAGVTATLEGYANPGLGEAKAQSDRMLAAAKVEAAGNVDDVVPVDVGADGSAVSHTTDEVIAELEAEQAGLGDLRMCLFGGGTAQ